MHSISMVNFDIDYLPGVSNKIPKWTPYLLPILPLYFTIPSTDFLVKAELTRTIDPTLISPSLIGLLGHPLKR